MRTTWLLICNRTEAYIYDLSGGGGANLQYKKALTPDNQHNPENNGRPGLKLHITPYNNNELHFAKELAGFLEDAFAKKHYQQLIIFSEPYFHGALLKYLPMAVDRAVACHVQKDLCAFQHAAFGAFENNVA